MKTQSSSIQITKHAVLMLIVCLLGWLSYGCSSHKQGNQAQPPTNKNKPNNGQNMMKDMDMGTMNMTGMNMNSNMKKGNKNELILSPIAMKIANIETTPAIKKAAVKHIRLPGKVKVDERKVATISANFSGRVEKLYVNFTGAYVNKGDKLASIYSPALVTAQKELLQTYKMRKSDPALYRAARQKLKHWEIPSKQIDQIIQTGEPQSHFIIRAHQSGYVTKQNVAVGDYLTTGNPMFKIANLSTVWIVFQASGSEILGLSTGDKINFTIEAYPGRTFEAKITYISPIVQKDSRTVSIRTEISNENGLLKPNMLAKGIISVTLYEGKPVLQVPQSAVLWTGKRSLVWVKRPDSSQSIFIPQEVVLGPSLGNSYVILDGLKAGKQVVVQGNFMIDAAAQLAGKKSMMNPNPSKGGKTSMPGMAGMSGMDMGNMNMNSSKMKSNKKGSNSDMDMKMN